ncbi:MBL fold metallo-hydrolase [Nesterenkonia aerolata]|uniref:MBL fold metallo-hydrolase n=1 Tax=Nesterenkonia aerolata TaxID=3074079 RepID=A0ABU2DT51_9MICC|nr:MBL fold metallo-hydrolase [Nesterenkonia sp. LY-0111]MDR8019684.1 MBL fold metallo-hydrolase [Nesterenkonia sp. LY-0111]
MTATLTVLGASACAPTPLGPASGYLLEHSGGGLLIDCGPGVVARLAAEGLLDRVTAVLASHSHADHCADLTVLAYRRSFPTVQRALPLYAPTDFPGKLDGLDEVFGIPSLSTMRTPLRSQFDLIQVEPGQSLQIDGLSVETIRADHPVPTLSMRFPDLGFVYTADTGYTEELVELSREARLLLAEATYRAADGIDVTGHGHLDGHTVGDLGAAAEVRHLAVTHLADPAQTADIEAEARTRFGGELTMVKPGMTFEL